jgi:hypothetical protein
MPDLLPPRLSGRCNTPAKSDRGGTGFDPNPVSSVARALILVLAVTPLPLSQLTSATRFDSHSVEVLPAPRSMSSSVPCNRTLLAISPRKTGMPPSKAGVRTLIIMMQPFRLCALEIAGCLRSWSIVKGSSLMFPSVGEKTADTAKWAKLDASSQWHGRPVPPPESGDRPHGVIVTVVPCTSRHASISTRAQGDTPRSQNVRLLLMYAARKLSRDHSEHVPL